MDPKIITQTESLFSSLTRAQVRRYQIETVAETVFELFGSTNAVLIESPTGSGKTIMGLAAATLLSQKGFTRVGWVAMRRNLLVQAQDAIAHFGFPIEIIPISMFDSNPPQVDVLVVDEAHHDAAASCAHIHKISKPKKVIGLSATPLRSDRAELIFEKTISRAGIFELVRLGYLARADHFTLTSWTPANVTAAYLQDEARWGKSAMFFFTREECEQAAAILVAAGVAAEVVHASSDRNRQLDDFEEGKLTVLVNMAILTEGFDCPSLQTVWVRPSNKGLTQQMAGRVLRPFNDLRKKIVQSSDTESNFQKMAPVGRTFRQRADGTWQAMDYDAEKIARLVARSNQAIARSSVSPELQGMLNDIERQKKIA